MEKNEARTATAPHHEAGFTLIEALIAIVILVFGLIAVTNLMVVGASSNTVGKHSSAATAQATEVMERLKGISFEQLEANPGGNLAADAGTANCADTTVVNCVRPSNFNVVRGVPGVGPIKTRWSVENINVGGVNMMYIRVRSEGMSRLVGARSRAEFTTFRTPSI